MRGQGRQEDAGKKWRGTVEVCWLSTGKSLNPAVEPEN